VSGDEESMLDSSTSTLLYLFINDSMTDYNSKHTTEDYEKPKQIAIFVAELFAGFRLLNLKNDGLRKRFDSIKYDLKKCEEIVYDIAIRGLSNSQSAAAIASTSSNVST